MLEVCARLEAIERQLTRIADALDRPAIFSAAPALDAPASVPAAAPAVDDPAPAPPAKTKAAVSRRKRR
jgi:hypothetical protein